MSHTAPIRSHRKPRTSTSTWVLRKGVTGGVLGTLVVTGASASANAGEPATQTMGMLAFDAASITTASQVADTTQQVALHYELQAAQEKAATDARKVAAEKKAKLEAKRRAEAEHKARMAAERKKAAAKAQERLYRSLERLTPGRVSSAPATRTAATLVGFLKAQVGKAYVLGATGPYAYDCSGLMKVAFGRIGINLPRVSQAQATVGTQVSLDTLRPGDILYWGKAGNAYHVAAYIGGGKFIGAQNSSTGVVKRDLSWDPPTGAVRVL